MSGLSVEDERIVRSAARPKREMEIGGASEVHDMFTVMC